MAKLITMFVFVLSVASFANAEESAVKKGPCAKDFETLCGNVEPGEGRIKKCLEDSKDKLSAECKAHHEQLHEQFKGVKEACHDDAEKLCGDVKAGHGRIMKCMKEHREELSAGCKAEVKEVKAKHKK